MNPSPAPKPWRFVALCDIPELGVLQGDIVSNTAGRAVRVTRRLPANPGLLLNLAMDDKLAELDEMIGPDSVILAAFDKLDAPENPSIPPTMRVIR